MPAGARREPNQVGNRILTSGYQVWTSQKGYSQAGGKTHSRNVAFLRPRTTRQQRRKALGPNSRTIVAACLSTSIVVMTPFITDPTT